MLLLRFWKTLHNSLFLAIDFFNQYQQTPKQKRTKNKQAKTKKTNDERVCMCSEQKKRSLYFFNGIVVLVIVCECVVVREGGEGHGRRTKGKEAL